MELNPTNQLAMTSGPGKRIRCLILMALLSLFVTSSQATEWWNPEWSIRKKITVDTGASGFSITEPIGSAVILVRLHEGNFAFASALEDGSDLRFVASDEKTLLPFHIEKFDALLNEAFIWVKLSDVKPAGQNTFWLYYGNSSGKVARVDDAKATYDGDTALVYHFSEHGAAPVDSTGNSNTAAEPGRAADGAIIGTGLRLEGKAGPKLPESASLAWNQGGPVTWSAWVKLASLQPNAVIFSRREEGNAMSIGVDTGIPFVEVTSSAGRQRSKTSEPAVAAGTWHHLAMTAAPGQISLYLDGLPCGELKIALPALKSAAVLGADNGFTGEIDELEISKTVRSLGAIKLAATGQGPADRAAKLIAIANDEQSGHGEEGELAKHLSLIKDISKSLTFDGWAVIFLCAVLAIVGWVVTGLKFVYLSKIKKGTDAFLKQWNLVSADLGALDHSSEESINSMGGKANAKLRRALDESPLYHLYKIGFAEIQHRAVNARHGFSGLSGRSIQSIKATLDGGLTREVQRLNSHLVFLTIGIAGGPYLGLLGTVIGVMITFAVIAKSGEVEVNSIAPGIAGALLATVAGLAVAIPALFAYSYISSRIKDAVGEMQIFIDEFIAKMAEAFPSDNE